MTLFLLTLLSLYTYIFWLWTVSWKFKRQRDRIQWRVHVNGIRGKSTVTRYVAAGRIKYDQLGQSWINCP